jgi:hypothetical protein
VQGRPPKKLLAHIEDRTFRPSRHAALLDREDLPASAPKPLRELQDRYRSTAAKRVRAAIAVEFAEAVHSGGAGPRLTGSQAILAQVGPIQLTFAEAGGVTKWFELDEAWEVWDRDHGARWRRLHDVALPADEERRGARGRAPVDDADEWPPDPPGWHLVSAF